MGLGGFRVLACADTGSETHLGVRQYFILLSMLFNLILNLCEVIPVEFQQNMRAEIFYRICDENLENVKVL